MILADEPTGNLDSKASREVLDILTGLNKSGHTIVLITHDPECRGYCRAGCRDGGRAPSRAGGGMSLLRTFNTGMRGLLGHRLRSILTTLGILFGVAAVICTVGIGTASADSVNSRIAALGTNLLTVSPGSTTSFGVRGGSGSANTLTMEDVTGLEDKQDAPDVAAVAPVVSGRATLVSTSTNWSTTVEGSTPGWLMANARTLSAGVFFTQQQVNQHAQVVVLGTHDRAGPRRHRRLSGDHLGCAVRCRGHPDTVRQHRVHQQR